MLRRKRKEFPTNRNQHYQKQSQEKHFVSKISKGITGVYKLHSSRHRGHKLITQELGMLQTQQEWCWEDFIFFKVRCKWLPAFSKAIPPKQLLRDISKHNTGVYKLHSSRHRGIRSSHRNLTTTAGTVHYMRSRNQIKERKKKKKKKCSR